jgi:hypothetical protein
VDSTLINANQHHHFRPQPLLDNRSTRDNVTLGFGFGFGFGFEEYSLQRLIIPFFIQPPASDPKRRCPHGINRHD